MAEPQYDSIQLVGLHEPDYSMEPNADGGRDRADLPGLYSVGFLANGKFTKIATVKAGDIVDKKNKVKFDSGSSSKDAKSDESKPDES